MRYDKTVYFVEEKEDFYNPLTGNYEEAESVKVPYSANINDESSKNTMVLYGSLTDGALIVRIKNILDNNADYMLISGEKYDIKQETRFSDETVFHVVKRK